MKTSKIALSLVLFLQLLKVSSHQLSHLAYFSCKRIPNIFLKLPKLVKLVVPHRMKFLFIGTYSQEQTHLLHLSSQSHSSPSRNRLPFSVTHLFSSQSGPEKYVNNTFWMVGNNVLLLDNKCWAQGICKKICLNIWNAGQQGICKPVRCPEEYGTGFLLVWGANVKFTFWPEITFVFINKISLWMKAAPILTVLQMFHGRGVGGHL